LKSFLIDRGTVLPARRILITAKNKGANGVFSLDIPAAYIIFITKSLKTGIRPCTAATSIPYAQAGTVRHKTGTFNLHETQL
jgi:hypothetical protein